MMQNKQIQRQYCLTQRNNLSSQDILKYSKIINDKLLEIIHGNILSYVSTKDEVDTSIINSQFNVSLPVIQEMNQMEAYIPNKNNLIKNKYGILEPNPNDSILVNPIDIDYVVVPLVGFDNNCNRLGHGAGYYDRYLTRCTHAIKIGIAFECQKLEKVIIDKNDIPLDYIITEQNTYKK